MAEAANSDGMLQIDVRACPLAVIGRREIYARVAAPWQGRWERAIVTCYVYHNNPFFMVIANARAFLP